MTWAEGPFCAFDTESTGVDPTQARIVTAAIVGIGPGPGQRATVPHDWLINPGVPIPPAAAAIHGVTDEQAQRDGRDPAVALPEITDVLHTAWAEGVPVVAFNACYDLTLLDHELARHGLPRLEVGPVIDPLVLDRQVDKYRKGSRKLDAVCAHHGVVLDQAHEAGADATAAARLAWRLGRVYTEIAAMSLDELHQFQVDAQAAWATNYQSYLRGRGGKPDAVIDPTWPVRPVAWEAAA